MLPFVSSFQGIVEAENSKEIEQWNFFKRFWLLFRTALVRTGILLFYMLFIVVFVAFQVTSKDHRMDMVNTVFFRNEFFNFSSIAFLINATVQLIAGFYLSGQFRTASLRAFVRFFDG